MADVRINCGGTLCNVSNKLVRELGRIFPGNLLTKLSEIEKTEMIEKRGYIFIDRNGQIFQDFLSLLDEVLEQPVKQEKEALMLRSSNKLTVTQRTSTSTTEDVGTKIAIVMPDTILDLKQKVQERWNGLISGISLLKKLQMEQELEYYGIELSMWLGASVETVLSTAILQIVSKNEVTVDSEASNQVETSIMSRLRPVKYQTEPMSQFVLSSQVNLERFKDQIIKLRNFMNENILLVAAICVEPPTPFVLVPRVHRDQRSPIWQENANLTLVDALALFRDVASGLSGLHRAGLLHLHLTPSSIYYCKTITKIAFFGDFLEYAPEDLPFVAPERMNAPSSKSDVYAWAMCVVALLWPDRFKAAFTDKFRSTQLCESLRREDRIPLPPKHSSSSNSSPPFDPAFKRLLLACLNPDPSKRPDFLTPVPLSEIRGTILTEMHGIILRYGIRRPEGQAFWSRQYGGQVQAVADSLVRAILFSYPLPSSCPIDMDTAKDYLYTLLGEPFIKADKKPTQTIPISEFGKLLDCFGPLDSNIYERLCDRFDFVAFIAGVTRKYTETILESGMYLIRISSIEWGTRGTYVYSYRDSESSTFKHRRFGFSTSKDVFCGKEKSQFSKLGDFILTIDDLQGMKPQKVNWDLSEEQYKCYLN